MSTSRLLFTPLCVDDAEEMHVVLGDAALHEFIGGAPLPIEELRARYARLALGRSPDGAQTWVNFIVRLRESGVAVGTVQATIVGADAHIAWVIGVRWQGHGFASEAARALVAHLEERGVVRIRANVHPQHVASQRVAMRAGLTRTVEIVDGEEVWLRSAAR